MQTYITQVELDDDSQAAHDRLTAAMEAHGFSRVFLWRGDQRCLLPPGHYCKAAASIEEVRSAARSAASLAAPWFSEFSCEMADREWSGVDFVSGLSWERAETPAARA
ncbi:MAG TPA: hypothetical protein VHE37_01625 [Nevskiaceae bacterium]|nr:hypothetical protein [Nevskiaceae bacterium]